MVVGATESGHVYVFDNPWRMHTDQLAELNELDPKSQHKHRLG